MPSRQRSQFDFQSPVWFSAQSGRHRILLEQLKWDRNNGWFHFQFMLSCTSPKWYNKMTCLQNESNDKNCIIFTAVLMCELPFPPKNSLPFVHPTNLSLCHQHRKDTCLAFGGVLRVIIVGTKWKWPRPQDQVTLQSGARSTYTGLSLAPLL